MRFKGVLIDFGGTLAYIDEVENTRYEEALVSKLWEYGCELHLKDLDAILADIYASSTKGDLNAPQEFWGLVLGKLGIPEQPELIGALETIKSAHAPAMWKLYDGVLGVLAVLQKKYRLALVSNCTTGTDRVLDSLGLTSFFGCMILSYQTGVRKPDRRMYHEALKCLRLESEECVFVADEISDLEGAREIGIETILVQQGRNRFQDAKNLEFRPDFQISQISEIINVL